jgi:hypothetical protein
MFECDTDGRSNVVAGRLERFRDLDRRRSGRDPGRHWDEGVERRAASRALVLDWQGAAIMTTDCREAGLAFAEARPGAEERAPRMPVAPLLAFTAAILLVVPRSATPPAEMSPAAPAPSPLVAASPAAPLIDPTSEAVRPLNLLADPRVVAALSPPRPDWHRPSTQRPHPGGTPAARKTLGDTETFMKLDASLGPGSGHLAITGTGLNSHAAALGFNAGAAYKPGPIQFDLGLTGTQSGSWNALATGKLDAGKLTFTASRSESGSLETGLAPGQLAASVATNSEILSGVTLHGALNWSRNDGSATDTRSYSGGIDLSRDLGTELKLIGNASVTGSGTDTWLAMPAVSGSAGLQWSPGGGPALSASISDQIGGSYHLSMALARPFN